MKAFFSISLLLLACLALPQANGDIFDESKAKSEQIPGAKRDSLWWEGHRYRQWIYDQNSIDDHNSNLDQGIKFLAEGKIRSHPKRVYFYNNTGLAVRIAAETKWPLAFYVFDHTCTDCLYDLPNLYTDPEIVEASQKFINVYIELPRQHREAVNLGIMNSGKTVQFFLPGLRRLRVVDSPDREELLLVYDMMLAYIDKLTEEALMKPPRRPHMSSKSSDYR